MLPRRAILLATSLMAACISPSPPLPPVFVAPRRLGVELESFDADRFKEEMATQLAVNASQVPAVPGTASRSPPPFPLSLPPPLPKLLSPPPYDAADARADHADH